MREKPKHALQPTWCFPYRLLGKDCTFVAQTVWNVRWQRDLSRQQKLIRAQAFRDAPKEASSHD